MATQQPAIPAETLLSSDVLKQAGKLIVFDDTGRRVEFGSIFAEKKTIVVFVRHFFCGMCQAYVSELSKASSESMKDADAQIVVVGCGEWKLIKSYGENCNFPSSNIYADPSRELYKSLGMTVETLRGTPKGETPRGYIPSGFLTNALASIWRGPLRNPLHLGKQGNMMQLGGDFVFGPGLVCSYARPMEHTQDHIEVSDLLAKVGVKRT